MDPDSDEFQICEIEVKKMYITVEKKVSALLQEELRQVGMDMLFHVRILITSLICLRDMRVTMCSNLLRIRLSLVQAVGPVMLD